MSFKKGRIPWNKGKKGVYTKEQLKKMSESQKKRMSNPEQRKRFLESRKGIITGMSGKRHSEESRRKMSSASNKRWSSSEYRKKISEAQKRRFEKEIPWNKGKTLTEETKRKISESTKKTLSNPEVRKRLSESLKGNIPWNKGLKGVQVSSMKGKHHTEESRKKMSTSQKKRMAKPEEKKRISKIFKKAWLNPKIRQYFKERRAKQIFPLKDSKPEIKIQNFLEKLNIIFLKHKYLKEIKHSYQCDIFIPSINLIIECDGDYWHKYPVGRDIDKLRTKELIEKGFNVLRIWESDIKKMNLNDFKDKIEEILKLKSG